MKSIKFLFIAVLAVSINSSCSAQTKEKEDNTQVAKAGKVEVFYFHYTRRCATCNAVESVTKEVIADKYPEKVSFAEYNLEEMEGEIKGKELDISGQTLLIVADNAKINITTEGFLNARSNPEKLKQIIQEHIDTLL